MRGRAHSLMPSPIPETRVQLRDTTRTGALVMRLRFEYDHAPRYRGATQGKDDRRVVMVAVVLSHRADLPGGVKTSPWLAGID